jgi:predicted ATPase with chaperone activity
MKGRPGLYPRSSDAWVPCMGDSRLTRRLTTVLPDLTPPEVIDTTRIHRVAGLTGG